MTEWVYCLIGPTAAGKTALAIALAQIMPIEIISVDSALVYRGMDIGTAKPNEKEQREAVHHLLDIIYPDETYSAAQFCEDATAIIANVQQRGKIPLLVGGTMMYFNALQRGLAKLPAADEAVRAEIAAEAAAKGWTAMHARLHRHDPDTAARVKPQDHQRIQRALEVYHLTGLPLSILHQQTSALHDYQFKNILLMPERRSWLHERIARRFDQMLAEGFLQEASAVLQQWPAARDKPAFKMVGYRQALDYFEHLDTALLSQKAIAATRQLAKRQLTWMRHWPNGVCIDPESRDVEQQLLAQFHCDG